MPGASVCLPCPAGMACSSAATVQPLSCPRGKQHTSAAKPFSCNQNNHAHLFLPAHSSGSPQGMPYLPITRARSAFPLAPFFSEQFSFTSPCTGYYCPAGTAAPLPCPEGTLNSLEGALALAACKLCPVGRYCRGDANWEPDGESD